MKIQTYKVKHMVITKDYLLTNRTKRQAWTKRQLNILGVDYPPRKGWMNDLEGIEITEEQHKAFSKYANRNAPKAPITSALGKFKLSALPLNNYDLVAGVAFLSKLLKERS